MSGAAAFFRAVCLGSLAGAAPGLLFSIPIGLAILFGDGNVGGLPLAFAPLIISVPVVLGASLLLGLPVTILLARRGMERSEFYAIAGLAPGAALFLVLLLLPYADGLSVLPLSLLGALSGSVTGWIWGRHREEVAGRQTD